MKLFGIVIGVLLAILVIAIGVLAAWSARKDAGRLTTSVVIHARPAVIWPYLYEPDKLKSWVSWLVDVRRENSGAPVPGGHDVWVMQDRNNGNARMEIASTVVDVEPDRRMALALSAQRSFSGTSEYRLVTNGDGLTRLESDSMYRFDNGLFRLLTPLVIWQAKKKMDGDLGRLRELVEHSAASGSSGS